MELKRKSLILSPMAFMAVLILGFVWALIPCIPNIARASSFYTIQLSSPLKEKQAHELVAKLKAEGVSSFEARVIIKGKKHFRVCSGYYENPKRAEEGLRIVMKHTHRKDIFVQRLNGSSLPDRMVLGDFD